MKKCYCCGADVPDQSKFCPKCGKPMEITQDLIDRAKAGDSDAQTELYERTYKTVYSRIRAKVPDEDTVMDIMQESYLSAFTNLDQLQKAATFPSWLLTIASRQVCAWYRKNGKENENVQMSQLEYENDDTVSEEDDLLDQPEYREDFQPDESLDRAETGRLLSEILDTLPEDQRIILTMRYYDELSLKEISEELGVNLSTVKTRLTAGKKKVEAKVLELEKSGTKLYSLGPVAFLVFLLHHMELFAPSISANTVIGLTAAGAGTAAGGTAVGAAGVTGKAAAGAAVKAAGGAAVKGLGVRIAAVAAAVVVAGGITTAVIVSINDHSEAEPTPSPEESVSEEVGALAVEPPSDDTVMEMAEDLNKWIANSDLGSEQIDMNLDTACELAATLVSECGYTDGEGVIRTDEGDTGGHTSEISEEALDQCLHDLFGSEYQASDFQNTEGSGMIQTDYPDYHTGLSGHLVKNEDGNFSWDYTGWEDVFADAEPAGVTDISPVEGDEEACTATVRYDWYISDDTGEQKKLDGSADVTFRLKSDDDSRYGWVITAVQEGPYTETNGKAIKSITERTTDGTISRIWTFDINGNNLTDSQFAGESPYCLYEYTYDDNGSMLSSSYVYYFDGIYPDSMTSSGESTYDSNGNTLTAKYYFNGDLYELSEYTYDDRGNMLTHVAQGSGGKMYEQYEYTYDSNGNKLSSTYKVTSENEIPASSETRQDWTYDDSGNMLTQTITYNGTTELEKEYTYDNDGHVLTYENHGFYEDDDDYNKNTIYDHDINYSEYETFPFKREYTYDSDGNILTCFCTYYYSDNYLNVGGSIADQIECIYDGSGNILTATIYGSDGNKQGWDEYTYDSSGYRLTETTYNSDGQAQGQTTYENEYYERFPGDFT